MPGLDRAGRLLPWQQAWQQALYAPTGFFVAGCGPASHFRTAVHAAAPVVAGAVLELARRHGCGSVVDVGAGRGELLTALADLPAGADGVRLHGVDVVDRPQRLPARVAWSRGLGRLPDAALDGALVVAWELLDDIPCAVLEVDDDGFARQVLVEPVDGREALGPRPDAADLEWCRRWWPLHAAPPGTRAEVGRLRDDLWGALVGRMAAQPGGGVLLAVDYAHRCGRRPPAGSLAAFRAGRAVPPVPDGSCDLTAHVALDAVAAAGEAAGATGTWLTDQRTALIGLGVTAGDPPPPGDGQALLRHLATRSAVAELVDPASWGGFGWLLQSVRR